MTDRELIELAAKAAGIGTLVWGEKYKLGDDEIDCTDLPYIRSGQQDESDVYWNPLDDDGDALRLAVKLRLTISWDRFDDGDYATATSPHTHQGYDCFVDQDPFAATRRAIVRAAALAEQPADQEPKHDDPIGDAQDKLIAEQAARPCKVGGPCVPTQTGPCACKELPPPIVRAAAEIGKGME